MKYILKEMSSEEKPRERLKKYGVSALSDYELLALIIKSAIKDKSVIDLSIEIMSYFNSLSSINDITLSELTKFKGLGDAKAISIIASIELGKRLISMHYDDVKLDSPDVIYEYVRSEMSNLKQEHFVCIYVDVKLHPISKRTICIGNINQTNVDIKEALKWALKYSCYGIIYLHNHPSGDAMPSKQDILLTEDIKMKTFEMDLEFIDHIIVGKNSFYSFRRASISKL